MNDVDKHVLGQKLSREELLKRINAWSDPEGKGYTGNAGVAVYDDDTEEILERPKKSKRSRRSSKRLAQVENEPVLSNAATAEGSAAVPHECNHAGNDRELEKGGFFGLFGKKEKKPAPKKKRGPRKNLKKLGKATSKAPRKGRGGKQAQHANA